MECRITVSDTFLHRLKKLSKRYKSLRQDVENLGKELRENPLLGVDLGNNLRKIRLAITSKGKGKSAGARVITYVVLFVEGGPEVKLLTIYDKSDQDTITDKELLDLMKQNGL